MSAIPRNRLFGLVASMGLPLANAILNRFGWGIVDTSHGYGGVYFPHHVCFYRLVVLRPNSTLAAGDIMFGYDGSSGLDHYEKRANNSRAPHGVSLDTIVASVVDQRCRMAVAGYVDVAWNGGNRAALGDLIQAGDLAGQYHIAKQAWGSYQMGHSAYKCGVAYYDANYARIWLLPNLK